VSDYMVPISSPDLTSADTATVNQVLATRYLSLGPCLAEFEERFAAYVGARHVSSGTTGLHLCINCARSKPRSWITGRYGVSSVERV